MPSPPQTPQWNGINGKFGRINIDGPDVGKSGAQEVGFKFKFVNRATNQPVNISWMQFTLFDFDEDQRGLGREARDQGNPLPPPSTPPPPNRLAHTGASTGSRFAVREGQGVRRLRALLRPWRGDVR